MNLIKKDNVVKIIDNNGKTLEVIVDIKGNLDFRMNLTTPRNMSNKEKAYFMIKDDINAQNIYFSTSKLFEDLTMALSTYKNFYETRFQDTPVYNDNRQCFKIHSDTRKSNELDFIRFFRKDGVYYFVFNQNPTNFYLSKLNTRYPDFAKAFNKFYSSLERECKVNNPNVKNKKANNVFFNRFGLNNQGNK